MVQVRINVLNWFMFCSFLLFVVSRSWHSKGQGKGKKGKVRLAVNNVEKSFFFFYDVKIHKTANKYQIGRAHV